VSIWVKWNAKLAVGLVYVQVQSVLFRYGCSDSKEELGTLMVVVHGFGPGTPVAQPAFTPTASQTAPIAASSPVSTAAATVALRASQKFAYSGRLVKPS
jgi:hypothetical protein